jgi:hypothetical protein
LEAGALLHPLGGGDGDDQDRDRNDQPEFGEPVEIAIQVLDGKPPG